MPERLFPDSYYMDIAREAARKSRCLKKQLGVALVVFDTYNDDDDSKEHVIEGWNGPPNGIPTCTTCRKDGAGERNADFCRAIHAERAAILEAALVGAGTCDSVLFSAMGIPCKNCLLELIAAGVKEIVLERWEFYDEFSRELISLWTTAGGVIRCIDE